MKPRKTTAWLMAFATLFVLAGCLAQKPRADLAGEGEQSARLSSKGRPDSITLAYETFGNPRDPALLLIMGMGCQMVQWPDAFCRMLADRGLFVVRFDNRDIGRSTKLTRHGTPSYWKMVTGKDPAYLVSDMAADTLGLMDSLGIEKAHLCGLSMGGMIAQAMAIEYPDRVLSLTSVASTTGQPGLAPPRPRTMQVMFTLSPKEREANIERLVKINRQLSGKSPAFDEELAREIAALSFDRNHHPPGVMRQMNAIRASPSRKEALGNVEVPTLVIHGERDTLLPPDHGRATAAAIPGARLLVIQDMGHGMEYPSLWPQMVQAIESHVKSAEPAGKETGQAGPDA